VWGFILKEIEMWFQTRLSVQLHSCGLDRNTLRKIKPGDAVCVYWHKFCYFEIQVTISISHCTILSYHVFVASINNVDAM